MTLPRTRPTLAILAFVGLTLPAHSQPLIKSDFPPSRQSPGDKLFSLVEAEESGLLVDNQYDDPLMWTHRYREFMGGGMGSGVCAGDFDSDGKVDLYVSTKTQPGRLFRNLGGWKFEDVTDDAGLSEKASMFGWISNALSEDEIVWRQGAVFADVNNDGWLDLYVCRNRAANLLYINQGDGSFEEEGEKRGLNLSDGSVVGSFVDYDRDGWLDVLVLTNQVDGTESQGRQDRLFRNTGKGSFVEVTKEAGIQGSTFGHAATWFDYNEDRWPDLYIANDFSGNDYLYRNNQDGTFTNVLHEIAPSAPYSSMGADTADINNDGHIDLLVADMATTNREKDRRGLAASRADVLTTGTTEGIAPQYTRNSLLLNTGLGLFGESACWAGIEATDWTWSVRFEDFDQDGWTDLHVTNGMVREANNSDLLARMMRALSDMQRIAVMKRAPPLNESNLAYRNLSGEGFAEVTQDWGLTDIGVTFGAATADLDNDGDLDLAYLDYNGGLKAYRNNVSKLRSVQVRLRGHDSNAFGVGAVVRIQSPSAGTQSRTLTVARGYASGSELVAHFGVGSDDRIESLTVEWPSGATQRFSDLETNKAYLITEDAFDQAPPETPNGTLFKANASDFGLEVEDRSELAIPDKEQLFLPFRTDRAGPSITLADLDGDGTEDIFLGATTGSPHKLLLYQDNKYTKRSIEEIPSKAAEHGPALAFDADGDGDRDLLVTRASANAAAWPQAYQPILYLNDGKANFTHSKAIPSLAINAGSAVAADIDGDSDLDLFIGARSIPGLYPDTPTSVLLVNENGQFIDQTAQLAPALATAGLVKSALFRDVDGDGHTDLLLALEWDFVRYFRNDGQGKFTDRTRVAGFETGGRGWWNGLTSADFNSDGRLDFATGNLGLNTTYEATPESPALLFYGDFAQNGTQILAEAIHDQSEIYPLRSRVDIGAKLPSVLRRFPKNDDFAKANMKEVYGEAALQNAKRFEATNFRSGIFLSQADGSYRFEPLPPAAQIGPIISLVGNDLDGDGHLDLVATQNSDIAIPRFHGGVGLFLRGDSTGNFTAVKASESGIALPGNGRAIVSIDPDNDSRPDLFASRHGGTSVLLSNDSSDQAWLTVQVLGSAANLDAIGARLRISYSDGSIQGHEIGLGSGWHSQGSNKLYIASANSKMPLSIEATWPDGSSTIHERLPDSGPWIIAKPLGD
ncbi:FG-GAP-like repeat-containing protein [Pelagicoccus sp. SDUM812002]|uniref:FG-GAP-like repeat-containing protein n=1 Tax=Pelagicoccus sp. SDUM812002 TaxID=3041266 RepID=UPI00280D1FC9|nr:FG-GAP-like repeat-containing protein [Pelagicoccus sp. SDUM812002]MDQ8184339.1 FG-GAP-like repeat-containing protein [Pelagicoccus sp. SDUM812002]